MDYAVIGHPIKHTLSPVLHNSNFQSHNEELIYESLDVAPDQLKFIKLIAKENNLKGFNVTIPHKTEIIHYLNEVSNEAKQIGAVNTVKIFEDRWVGYNTDVTGYLKQYKEQFGRKKRKVLILGSGGASRAVLEAHTLNNDEVTIVSRNKTKVKHFNNQNFESKLYEEINDLNEYEVIVNTTSLGMNGENPLDLFNNLNIHSDMIGVDLVYTSLVTPFMTYFNEKNRTNGLPMLIYQAAAAYEIWTGKKADIYAMEQGVQHYL